MSADERQDQQDQGGQENPDGEADQEGFALLGELEAPTTDECETYRRRGFASWLMGPGGSGSSPETHLQGVLNDLTARFDARKTAADLAIERERAYIRARQSHHEGVLKAQKTRLEELSKTPEILRRELRDLERHREDGRRETVTAYEEVKTATQTAYKDELTHHADQASRDVDAIVSANLRTAKILGPLDHEAREVRNKRKQDLVEHLDNLQRRLHSYWEYLFDRVQSAAGVGITTGVAAAIYVTGLAAAIVAGWFFATFATAAGFRTHTYVSYLIARFVELAHATYARQSGNVLIDVLGPFLAWILVVIALLLIVTGIMALAQFLLERVVLAPEARFVATGEKNASKKRRSQREPVAGLAGPLAGWLRALPSTFGAGLTLALLALFVSRDGSDAATSVYDALAAETIGFLFAVAMAGPGILYTLWILEPRWERKRREYNSSASESGDVADKRYGQLSNLTPKFTPHIELFILFGLFLAFSISMLFVETPADANPSDSLRVVAVAAFVTMALFAGLSLAYGYRYRSLFAAEHAIERRLTRLKRKAQDVLPGLEVDPKPFRTLEGEVRARLYGLLDALEARMAALATKSTSSSAPPRQPLRRVWFRILRITSRIGWRSRRQTRAEQQHTPPEERQGRTTFFISDRDRLYAPAKAFEAALAHDNFQSLLSEIDQKRKRLRDLDLQRSEEEDEISAKLSEHGRALRAIAYRSGRSEREFRRYQDALLEQKSKLEACVHEGYSIGRTLYDNRNSFDPPGSPSLIGPPTGRTVTN